MPAKLPSKTKDDLEWIEVADFRPGIAQVTSPNHPDGTATETNTYGCIADSSSGALRPLPLQDVELSLPTAFPYAGAGTPETPVYAAGIFANDPVFSLEGGNQTLGGPDQNNTELYMAAYYWVLGAASQVNTLTMSGGTGGTFTITVDTMTAGVPDGTSQTTSAIAYNASAATIDAALEALSNVGAGDVTCAGGPINTTPVTLTWGGALANQSIHVYVTWKGTLTGTASRYLTSSVTTGADRKVREVWRRRLNLESPDDQEVYSDYDDTIWYASVRPRVCEFGTTRSNSGGPTVLGPVVVAFVFDGIARMFPDDTATASMNTAQMAGDGVALVLPAHLCLHQGRGVVFPLTLSSIGTNQVYTTTEGFYWTDVNDLTSLSAGLTGYFNVIVLPEFPVGYGVMESLTADELLLIKARGGGLILRGSLDDYSAKSLPNLKPTGQSLNRGCRTPLGFMYPVDIDGIWLWTGGDTSTNLSPNMEAEFWRPEDSSNDYPYGPGYTSCAQWGDWTLLPNFWIFDTSSGGYWKLEQTTQFTTGDEEGNDAPCFWTVDWKGRHAYAQIQKAPLFGTNEQIGYSYDRLGVRTAYSWQSQPLAATLDRTVAARKFVLVASGEGTVTVKVRSNRTGSEDTMTFTVDSESGVANEFPTAYMRNCDVTGSHLQVQISVSNSGADGDELRIHGFRCGVHQTAQLPVT